MYTEGELAQSLERGLLPREVTGIFEGLKGPVNRGDLIVVFCLISKKERSSPKTLMQTKLPLDKGESPGMIKCLKNGRKKKLE